VSYTVSLTPAPTKFLERLRDEALKRRLVKALRALELNPRPTGSLKMQGENELYRIRVGDFRIVYQIQDTILLALVVQIGNRRDIYRQ
jgi:mRNA interferase RelE/StbE